MRIVIYDVLFVTLCKDSICNDPKLVLGSYIEGPNNKFVESGLKG